MKKNAEYHKRMFMTYFDSEFAEPGVPSTYSMGVTRLRYNKWNNTLTVYLRRPGLLIGKGGRTIDEVKRHLDVEIKIKETDLIKDN